MAIQTLSAFTKTSKNGYVYGVSPLSAVNSSTADSVASDTITEELGGKKILVGFKADVAYADVEAQLVVEGSMDGTNWAILATASADTTPNTTTQKVYLVDLSSIYAPYYRLHWNNQSAVNVATSGKCYLSYAVRTGTLMTTTI